MSGADASALAHGAAVAALVLLGAAPWSSRGRDARVRAVAARGPAGPGGAEGAGQPALAAAPVDLTVLLELLGAAVHAGAGVPRALGAVGAAVGGPDGTAMVRAGRALVLGARWDDAWDGAPERLEVVAEPLRATWESGSAPAGALHVALTELRREVRARAQRAAGRLGVRLVVPLGLCFLPAFVLIGIVPVLISLGSGVLS
ncbi:type II secretion system F family protein [Cellulomonas sp. PhB143]|uniref:type II secretion system F family protein n=1 Tax=Cellulomonas sp. PhB143 TaxID=2485186 RepID=UPI000FB17E60|nr:type II secretion system F family protein [Cellulomonas sp. PhB143]ROS76576.1 type II secretion system (T2SS) protein F [Cellulomonas sp. PhB143]